MKNQAAQPMRIRESAFNAVIDHIGSRPAELGGALFGREDDYVISRFVPDTTAITTSTTYTINADALNPIIDRLWRTERLSLLGIVHSHPRGFAMLSQPDMEYFENLLRKTMKRDHFYAPIVFTVPDGGFRMIPHVIDTNGKHIGRTMLELLQDDALPPALAKPIQNKHMAEGFITFLSVAFSLKAARRAVAWQLMALSALILFLFGWFIVAIWPHVIFYTVKQLHQYAPNGL